MLLSLIFPIEFNYEDIKSLGVVRIEFLRRLLGLTTESENGLYSIRSMYNVPARIGSSVLNRDGKIGRIVGSKKGEWGYEIAVEYGGVVSFHDPTDLKYAYFDLFL